MHLLKLPYYSVANSIAIILPTSWKAALFFKGSLCTKLWECMYLYIHMGRHCRCTQAGTCQNFMQKQDAHFLVTMFHLFTPKSYKILQGPAICCSENILKIYVGSPLVDKSQIINWEYNPKERHTKKIFSCTPMFYFHFHIFADRVNRYY